MIFGIYLFVCFVVVGEGMGVFFDINWFERERETRGLRVVIATDGVGYSQKEEKKVQSMAYR